MFKFKNDTFLMLSLGSVNSFDSHTLPYLLPLRLLSSPSMTTFSYICGCCSLPPPRPPPPPPPCPPPRGRPRPWRPRPAATGSTQAPGRRWRRRPQQGKATRQPWLENHGGKKRKSRKLLAFFCPFAWNILQCFKPLAIKSCLVRSPSKKRNEFSKNRASFMRPPKQNWV